jgi:hypothetical protein
MKKFLLFMSVLLVVGFVQAQTKTYIGTIKDLAGNPVASQASAGGTQVAAQGAGKTVQSKSINGELNATLFGTGSDIGARIKAAIHALPNGCGTILIPAGTYSQNTTVVKPACVNIRGQSAGSTIINWTQTSGAAFVLADPAFSYPQGAISDLRLVGPGNSSSTIGIYIGGDPAGVISPSGSWGEHQNFDRVAVWYFGTGVEWGNNAWDNSFHESVITNNGTGVFYPGTVNQSGESISFFSTSIQNNTVQGINLIGYSDFYFYGSRCDYNATCGTVTGAVTAHFYGMHFEQGSNTMLTIGGGPDGRVNVYIDGGQIILSHTSGTDAQVFNVLNGAGGSLTIRNAMALISHPTTNFVTWSPTGGNQILHLEDLIYTNPENITNITSNCSFSQCHIRHAKYSEVASLLPVAANTCAEQDLGGLTIQRDDIFLAANKRTPQAGLALVSARPNPGRLGHLLVTMCNTTAASITPTPNDTYTFVVEQ